MTIPARDLATAVLEVDSLRMELVNGAPIIEDFSLTLNRGEILGLVGESGSGKTTAGLALLGYARPGVRRASGRITVGGHNITVLREAKLRPLRGQVMSYIPQEPGPSLNPSLRIAAAIDDIAGAHLAERPHVDHVTDVLARVGLPAGRNFRRRFPHQLSGGQQQRVAIAMSLVCEPALVVLDEPTTGLDVVTQKRILDEVARLRREAGLAIVYISHDLAVVASIADRVAVMYAGQIVEEGPTAIVLSEPKHPYTSGLLSSIPDHLKPRRPTSMPGAAVAAGERPPGCAFAPRCPQRVSRCDTEMPSITSVTARHGVRCFEWERTPAPRRGEPIEARAATETPTPVLSVQSLRAVHRSRQGTVVAADNVSFSVAGGECVALVGESGSGKTTIARCIVGLHAPAAGEILLDGEPLRPLARQRSRGTRRKCQIVFQNPYESLNPRHRIDYAIGRTARILRGLTEREVAQEVSRLLELVRLPRAVADRFPAELSGGERQRVAIARALAAGPSLLVCDEVTSALDVSVQAAVLELLGSLLAGGDLALLVISHDLGVVASIADRMLILERGLICEEGEPGPLLRDPQHPYTAQLVEAAPRLQGGEAGTSEGSPAPPGP